MKKLLQGIKIPLYLMIFQGVALGCASISDIKINYQLPIENPQLEGKRVVLTISDIRTDREILTPIAKKELKNFSGGLSLSVSQPNQTGYVVGIFEMKRILSEVFKRRLENEGLEVRQDSKYRYELEITLIEFLIDIVDRKWVVKMAYEARLNVDGKTAVTHKIGGEAERLSLAGTGSLDAVLSEIFTDLVNRLDLVSFFDGYTD